MCFAREHTSELTYVMAMRDGTADVALPHPLPIRASSEGFSEELVAQRRVPIVQHFYCLKQSISFQTD
jgi:hypothetical protein